MFKKYSKFIKEHALFQGDFDRYDNYLTEINDVKKTLKNIDSEIKMLISLFKEININEIRFDNSKYKDKENYEVKFNRDIILSIPPLEIFIDDIKNNNFELYNKICNLYFASNEPNFHFDVQIETNNFNKFHFPIDLPPIFKNLGLGKKIILSAIQNFEYLLFVKSEDSLELKLSVDSITKMNDVFSFMKDGVVLIMKDDFNLISNVLIDFYDSYENLTIDKDFLEKYKNDIIDHNFLSKLYKDYL